MRNRNIFLLILAIVGMAGCSRAPGPGPAPIILRWEGRAVPAPGQFACHPGEKLRIQAEIGTDIQSAGGIAWRWKTRLPFAISGADADVVVIRAPRHAGTYPFEAGAIVRSSARDGGKRAYKGRFAITVLRRVSDLSSGKIDGYAIGKFPDPLRSEPPVPPVVLRHPEKYSVPTWFVPIGPKNEDLFVSPRFRLRQFDHDASSRPSGLHYIPFSYDLVDKLEGVLSLFNKELHSRGKPYDYSGFHFLCGHRSPRYNLGCFRKDGSLKEEFSRHMYGDAADLFADQFPRDGIMDDLNDDGVMNIEDAAVIGAVVDRWEALYNKPGGWGIYSHHDVPGVKESPYIHIDTRGFKARWRIE